MVPHTNYKIYIKLCNWYVACDVSGLCTLLDAETKLKYSTFKILSKQAGDSKT